MLLLLYPIEDEKEGYTGVNIEARAGWRLCSKATVKVNTESTAHVLQGAEGRFQRHNTNVLVADQPPSCPLSLQGAVGRGALLLDQHDQAH